MLNKKRKLLYCNANLWRKVFLYKKNPIFKTEEKFIYSRSSIIPQIFKDTNLRIYNGKKWINRFVTKWMFGYKFGEFTWNRRLAIYKAKQAKKKK